MATVTIRFRDGDEETWNLHEAMQLGELARLLTSSLARGSAVSFGVASHPERRDSGFEVTRPARSRGDPPDQ